MSICKSKLWFLPLALALLLTACAEEDSRSAAEHFNGAQQFFTDGDLRSAAIEIKNAVRGEPKNPDFRWLAGQIYLASGKSTAAEQEFTKALGLGIERADSDLPLVRAWIAQGDLQKGLKHFEDKETSSLSDEAKLLFAELLLESGEIARAEALFSSLENSVTQASSAQLGLARIAITRGQTELADNFVQNALKLEPGNPFANLIAGELAVAERQFTSAQTYFTAAESDLRTRLLARLGGVRVQLASEQLSAAETNLAAILTDYPAVPLAHYLQGLTYYQLGESSAAVESLETTLSLAPKHNPTLLFLGKLYLDDGQLELANNVLTTLISSDPDNSVGRTLLAATKLRMDEPEEALIILGDLATEQSDDLLTLITAGSALLATDEFSRGSILLEKAASMTDDPHLIRSQLARAHLVAGDVDTAIEEYRALIENDSSNPQHHLLLAYSLVRQGKLEQAFESANHLEAQGLIALAANLKGAIELARQQPAKAKELFELAIKKDPEFVPARLNLARIAVAQKQFDNANKMFADVLEIDPKNVVATLGMANYELNNSDRSAAIDILKKAIKTIRSPKLLLALADLMMVDKNPVMALEYASQARQVAPQDPNSARTVAALQAKRGLHLEALETLETIPVSRRSDKFELHLAQLNHINDRPDRARSILTAIIERSPNNIDARISAMSMELEAGQISSAESLLAAFPDVDGKSHLVPTLQGDIHRAAERHQQAFKSYLTAFELNPSGNLIGSIAGELIALDQRSQATSRLVEWVGQHPDDLTRSLQLANIHMVDGEKDAAVALYEQILVSLPSQPIALNNLTWLYHELGNTKATELATQIADSNPEQPAVLDTAGWVLLLTGNKQRGLHLLTKAHNSAPGSAEIHFHLAVAEQRNGNLEAAAQLLAELQNNDPEYAQRAEVVDFAAQIEEAQGAAP